MSGEGTASITPVSRGCRGDPRARAEGSRRTSANMGGISRASMATIARRRGVSGSKRRARRCARPPTPTARDPSFPRGEPLGQIRAHVRRKWRRPAVCPRERTPRRGSCARRSSGVSAGRAARTSARHDRSFGLSSRARLSENGARTRGRGFSTRALVVFRRPSSPRWQWRMWRTTCTSSSASTGARPAT